MLKKPEKNYFINVVLIIMSLVCIITGFMLDQKAKGATFNLRPLHIWTGYIMTAIIVVHLLMNIKWITSVTKKIMQSKKTTIALVATILVSVGLIYGTMALSPKSNIKGEFPGGRGSIQNDSNFGNQMPPSDF